MAVEIKHKFQSMKPDGGDGSVIRPSNWNDVHNLTMEGGRLLGRELAGNGTAQELTLGDGLEFFSGGIRVTYGTDAGSAAKGDDERFGDVVPVGVMMPISGVSVPPTWVRANGQTLMRASFPRLWAFVQTSGNLAASEGAKSHGQYGPGDGTSTFSLPNLEAEGGFFIRPVSSGRGIGTVQQAAMENHTHSGSTSVSGEHTHSTGFWFANNDGHGQGQIMRGGGGSHISTTAAGNHSHTFTTGNPSVGGGDETRPKNIAYPVIIKA